MWKNYSLFKYNYAECGKSTLHSSIWIMLWVIIINCSLSSYYKESKCQQDEIWRIFTLLCPIFCLNWVWVMFLCVTHQLGKCFLFLQTISMPPGWISNGLPQMWSHHIVYIFVIFCNCVSDHSFRTVYMIQVGSIIWVLLNSLETSLVLLGPVRVSRRSETWSPLGNMHVRY